MTMDYQRLSKLGNEIIDHRYKGIPLGAEVPLADLGKQGWNVARGDLALPITTLRADALENRMGAKSVGELAHALDRGITALADDIRRAERARGFA